MNVREKDGNYICKDCGYFYSSMLGDCEIPDECNQCYVYDLECNNCGDMTCAEVAFFYKDETYCDDCCPEGYGE